MRVCRASTGGLTGGQGPTRASQVFDLDSMSDEDQFGLLIVSLFIFHKPFQPPFTWWRLAILLSVSAPLHANGLTARTSTVLLWSGFGGDLLRVARLLGCDATGLAAGVAFLDALPGGPGWHTFSRRIRSRCP
jgi:hypothetical protein